jgi:hypothetical protein
VRTREAILAVVLGVALSACSGDDDGADPDPNPSAPVTEMTVDCDRFSDTSTRITDAQTALYSGTGGTAAIDSLTAELTALKADAPADVQTALTDMLAAFRDAEEILDNPTPENKAKLAELSPKLSADGQRITAYITSQCG